MVTFLSGGTGTPKLLWGSGAVFPREETTVIANTGDDIDLGGLHVSPDVDAVLYERAGRLDRETWWGILDDSTVTTDRAAKLSSALGLDGRSPYLPDEEQQRGRPLSRWRRFARLPGVMTIGDLDRAHHMARTELLEQGSTLTEATRALATAYDVTLELLPMSDDPVATIVHTAGGPQHFQEFWVRHEGKPLVHDVEFRGANSAELSPRVSEALQRPVVIGPANPVTSLGPMLAIEEFADALHRTPVVAVSPFRGEEAFSGPATKLMRDLDRVPGTRGMADELSFVDAFVLEETDPTSLERPVIRTDTAMHSAEDATRVAAATAQALAEVR